MISKKEVQHIAKLARLGLGQKEIEKMQKDLSLILEYFDLLREINTDKIKPTFHSTLTKFLLPKDLTRKDEVKKQKPETINKLIEAAPKKKKGYILTKPIL